LNLPVSSVNNAQILNSSSSDYIKPSTTTWLACSTYDLEVGVRVSLAAGGCVATMGQLLFASWAWAYSTFHKWSVNEYRLWLGRFKAGMCDAA